MSNIKGIHHIAIRVKDFDRTFDLYTRVLGMKCTLAWGEGDKRAAMLDTGNGACVELFGGSQLDRLPEGAFFHLAFATDDTDAAFAAAIAAGCTEQKAPFDFVINGQPAPLPVRLAFVYGYDGEILELFQIRI